MKRMIATMALSVLLWSCGGDKGTNDGGVQPTAWNPLDSLSFAGLNTLPRQLLIDGDILYVSGDRGFLATVDISNPDSLKLIGYHAASGGNGGSASAMAKFGSFVVCGYTTAYETPDTVIIFDVANPSSPQAVTILQSGKIPLSSGYYSFTDCETAGDTLMVWMGGLFLYRILPNGSPTLLDNLSVDGLGACPYSGLLSVWTESNFWYFLGVCIDTEHHPQLWVAERGTMNVVSRSAIPSEFYIAFYQGTTSARRACFYNSSTSNILELDYTNHASPTVTRTVAVPGGLGLPSDFPAHVSWRGLATLGTRKAMLANEGVVLLDENYQYLRHVLNEGLEWNVAAKGNRLYESGGTSVRVYVMQ